jgi:hypothetical protein
MSFDMASSIFLRLSSCCSSFEEYWILRSLVTPLTSRTIWLPKAALISAGLTGVSSMMSCISAAAIVSLSICRLAKIRATSTGCEIYGSPESRVCPSWAWAEKAYARRMSGSSCRRGSVAASSLSNNSGCKISAPLSGGDRDKSDIDIHLTNFL